MQTPTLKVGVCTPKTKEEIILETKEQPEIQRSTCTTCVVNTGEALIVVENSGEVKNGL